MSQIVCPACGSRSSRLARKGERPDVWFVIKSFRKCDECGCVFEPPTGRILGTIVSLLGVGSILAPVPGLLDSLSPFRPFFLVFYVFLAIPACIYGGLQMMNCGLQTWRTRKPHRSVTPT
ncbi:MAG TPA: hypothetical protein VM243_04655 [Phycisphaerae bacterium]|nr:hypothetical protein [Phycisphaerae bacterium]